MLKLHCDIDLTRRKNVHAVIDERQEILFTSKRLSDCIAWLWDNGHMKVELVHENAPDHQRCEIEFRYLSQSNLLLTTNTTP